MNKETNKLIKEIFEMYESMTLYPEGKQIIKDIKEMYFEKEDYKSRLEKAIKFIKENAGYTGIDFGRDLRNDKVLELLTILKGSEE